MPISAGAARTGFVKDAALALALCFFWVVVAVGPSVLVSTAENDAATVERIATGSIAPGGGNYAVMAAVFANTSEWMRTLAVLAVGSTYIILLFGNVRNIYSAVGALAISLPASILGLSVFQKDLTSFALVIVCFLVLSRWRRLPLALGIVVVLYAVYGTGFRAYYLIILAVFIALFLAVLRGWLARLYLCLGAMAVLAVMPNEIWNGLQSARDIVNIGRVGSNLPGAATAFYNIVYPDGLATLAPNYLYSAVRLNFSWLLNPRPQELALLAISALFVALAMRSWKQGIRSELMVLLFAAHVATLHLFEPDLGSYLRHMTTAALYLAPGLRLPSSAAMSAVSNAARA